MLQYQKEWLAWALKQESIAKGGILGDDMGMGKTVQAISLVLAKREIGLAISHSSLLSPAPYILPTVKGTLVICLVVAVIQWINEIDRFTTKGSNTILVYHGANREKNIGRFVEYDFVITTYSTLETEYRKNITILHYINWNCIIFYEITLREDCFDVKEEDCYRSLWDESRELLNISSSLPCGILSSSALARSGRTTNVVYVEQPCGLCHNPVEDPIVFLMDPWWNAVVERQAQDRIHQIKQYKPIRYLILIFIISMVVRFVIENTIEERILDLQEKKKLLFEGMVGGASEALECWN
uniref:DNA repair helicase rad5,16 n=1 Tax=Solanum tuberosum TaxID=4113 RepID=M0ZUW3_SOLTU